MGRHGENIRYRKDGRWEARMSILDPISLKRMCKYFYGRSYQEAKQKRADFIKSTAYVSRVQSIHPPVNGLTAEKPHTHLEIPTVTLEEATEDWLAFKKPRVKQATYVHYTYQSRKHLLPELGAIPLVELDADTLEDFIRRKLDAGGLIDGRPLSARTVSDLKVTLVQILKYAQKKGMLESIPACPTVSYSQPAIRVLTVEEQEKLVRRALEEDTTYILGVLIALYAGLRIGEVCALQWGDFDFASGTVTVRKTAMRIYDLEENQDDKDKIEGKEGKKSKENEGDKEDKGSKENEDDKEGKGSKENEGDIKDKEDKNDKEDRENRESRERKPARTKVLIDRPKTSCSFRVIPLVDDVARYFFDRCREDEVYVLTGTEKLMEPRVCLDRYKRLLRRAGVPDYNFHALRHTFATRCVEKGVDIKSLSEFMGHTDVSITMQRYVHPSMKLKKEQINKLNGFPVESPVN